MTYKEDPIIEIIGKGKPIVIVVGAMHGNEKVGIVVFQLLKSKTLLLKGTLKFIIANPAALEKNKRFIYSDLNRVFPGNSDGNMENRLAARLTGEIRNADYVLDLHSCSVESKPFCIIRNKRCLREAVKTGLSHFVLYPTKKQGGRSLIDFAKCGIGLELGKHEEKETMKSGFHAVYNFISSLGMTRGRPKSFKRIKIFKITGKIPKDNNVIPNPKINNFSLVRQNSVIGRKGTKMIRASKDFYPILFAEKSYNDSLCLIGEKVNIHV